MAQQVFQISDSGTVFHPIPGLEPRPVVVWEETPEGKRRPSDRQQTNAAGEPLWQADAVAQVLAFGEPKAEIISIQWAGEPTLPEALR